MKTIGGKYAVSKCSGNRTDKKGKLIELIVYCEVELDDGNKYWTRVIDFLKLGCGSHVSKCF